MSGISAPTQVLSSRLAASPEAVWAQVRRSDFIAQYLGASLPTADLLPGPPLLGTDLSGAPLQVTVLALQAPCSLSLQVSRAGVLSGLQLSIAACPQGCRITLLHETIDAGPECDTGLAHRLAAAPAALLSSAALGSAEALAAAGDYLAETATLVAALRAALGPDQGYELPPTGGFSLAQHVWHLADIEQFGWSRRFDRLLDTPQARLPGVDGDRLAITRRYQQRPWRPAALRFVRRRQHTLAALARCEVSTLQRRLHFAGQAATGADLLAALLAHDHEHRLALAALCAGLYRLASTPTPA